MSSGPRTPSGTNDAEGSGSSPAPERNLQRLINAVQYFAIFGIVALLAFNRVTHDYIQNIDNTWRGFIGAAPGDASYQWFVPMALQHGFDTIGAVAICLVLIIVCLVFKRYWHALFAGLSLALVAGGLVQGFKHLFNRERPADDLENELWSSVFPVDHGSFPSGHSAAAAVFAIMFLVLVPWQWKRLRAAIPYIGAALVLAMMWQRTLTNAHWLSDTVAGAALGLGGALLLWWFMQPWLDAEQREHLPAGVDAPESKESQ
jgi:undecaprenyl-diphosphatase